MMKSASTCQRSIWLGGVLSISRASNILDWTNRMGVTPRPSNHFMSAYPKGYGAASSPPKVPPSNTLQRRLPTISWLSIQASAHTLAALGFIAMVDEDADLFKDENRALKVNQWVFGLDNNKEISNLPRKKMYSWHSWFTVLETKPRIFSILA